MDHQLIISNLETNINSFIALLTNIAEEEQQWRAAPDKWTLVEIVSHLYDEEREDFRARLRSTLENPTKELPSIDPTGWVKERNYTANNFQDTAYKFLAERRSSVKWLKDLKDVNWKNSFQHRKFGSMSAEMFLSEWYSHDLLHMRQIMSTRYHYHRTKSGDQLPYAGNW